MDEPKKPSPRFLAADTIWILATLIFYILVRGASPYIKSFFMAGYLK